MTEPRRARPNVPAPPERPGGGDPRDPGSHADAGPGDRGDPGPGGRGDRLWTAFDEATREAAAEHGAGLHDRECLDWCPICRGADIVRATATPEMREQWQGIQRDALVAVRAMLDSYIERLERERRGTTRVEDIPIE